MDTVGNAAVAALITGLLCAIFGLQGCGVSYGGFTMGTTGYLAEVNEGHKSKPIEHLTEKNRIELSKMINEGK